MTIKISKKLLISTILSLYSLVMTSSICFSSEPSYSNSEATILQDSLIHKIMERFFYRPGAIEKDGRVMPKPGAQDKVSFDASQYEICYDAIALGVGKKDKTVMDLGIKAIEYAFARQRKDGSFENTPRADGARFLCAFIKSSLLIKNSEFKDEFLVCLDKFLPNLKHGAYNFINSQEYESEIQKMQRFCNQLFAFGFIFEGAGKIANDAVLTKQGRELFYAALNKMQDNGVFPEKEGYDSGYQRVSLDFMMYYYLYLAGPEEKDKIYTRLTKGWEWELSRIGKDGRIEVEGNTRQGTQKEIRHGKYKEINPPKIAYSLIYWAYLSNNMRLKEVAKNVINYFTQENTGSKKRRE